MPDTTLKQALEAARLVFWDFDGVIKDSLSVKTEAFAAMFSPFGAEVVDRVVAHHQAHGGISRFVKIPLYYEYAGIMLGDAEISEKCAEFSRLVEDRVVNSPWVPGVTDYLNNRMDGQVYALVTGTPQDEIERILEALSLTGCFQYVIGAPVEKDTAVHDIIRDTGIPAENTIFLGDASTDWQAANKNQVAFYLRSTPLNEALRLEQDLESFADFLD